MQHTWRWFGPEDPVSLSDVRQAGASGVVTALHSLAPGVVWDRRQIHTTKQLIEAAGLSWSVVESLPVSEEIKSGTGACKIHIRAYIESLHNLAAEGVKTICYNFMPVLDWTRTQLRSMRPNGALTMRFDVVDFAVFDIHILARSDAANGYPRAVIEEAAHRYSNLGDEGCKALSECVMAGLPGAATGYTIKGLREQLSRYRQIDTDVLRGNLTSFLRAVVPQAEALGIRLCCHPDDPPFGLLGLPRIVSKLEDLVFLVESAPSPANGIAFCVGSLGVRADNDLPAMIKHLAPHIFFLHLRNTRREKTWGHMTTFFEDEHLGGDACLPALIHAICAEETRRKVQGQIDYQIPMRPDHGQEILSDITSNSMPGYPAIGRLKGLAEIRGVEAAFDHFHNGDQHA